MSGFDKVVKCNDGEIHTTSFNPPQKPTQERECHVLCEEIGGRTYALVLYGEGGKQQWADWVIQSYDTEWYAAHIDIAALLKWLHKNKMDLLWENDLVDMWA